MSLYKLYKLNVNRHKVMPIKQLELNQGLSFNVFLLSEATADPIIFLHSANQVYFFISHFGRFDRIFRLFSVA